MSTVHDHPHEHGPNAPYIVQLLLDAPATLDRDRLVATLGRLVGPAQVVEAGERFVVSFADLVSRTPEGDVAAQASFVSGPVHRPDALEEALSQTWDWPEAREQASKATCALVVSDLLAGGLGRADRLKLVHGLVRATMEQVQPLALHWLAASRVVDPAFYLQSLAHGAGLGDAAVNVRFYRVPDGVPGECLMDTIGLAPFGLPDLQIHFSGLEPGAVAPVLLSYAEYLFDKGDVLGDDSLVRGVQPSDEWRCRRQRSLAPPIRDVVDIVPDEYAVKHG